MPTLSSPASKVLVTGANGYIGLWVVKILLDRGHTVRATVRSDGKAKELKDIFPSAGNKLEFAVVTDMLKEGAFDESVKDVDAIVHTASPLAGKGQTNEDYIRPAVDGTLGIFKSALKNGTNVKRIVTTSSVVALWSMINQHEVRSYTEEDWNQVDLDWVKDESKEFHHIIAYSASKTLAEKAAWDFHKAHKDEVGWDISFVLPSMVYGPPVQTLKSPEENPSTQKMWWDSVMGGEETKTKEFLSQGANWIDVRDVAEAHVRSLEKEAAGNERIILSFGKYTWQDWLEIVNATLPSVAPNSSIKFPAGFKDIEDKCPFYFDGSKEKKILGIPLKTKEDTTKDILEQAVKFGWI
ncbi:hypothetical protein NMY22_g10114 [Coprinellus aureogranulatus]|nr:hypothetical protein NMY22_g10114 [Coprinellus aureogranulatus]